MTSKETLIKKIDEYAVNKTNYRKLGRNNCRDDNNNMQNKLEKWFRVRSSRAKSTTATAEKKTHSGNNSKK